jgi:hypothetical protein
LSQVPNTLSPDSATKVKRFFDKFYQPTAAFSAADIDSAIGYFLKRGFEEVSATSTANILLAQARIDKIPVQKLLDTLDGVNDVQLNNVVGQILNNSRDKTSQLGFKTNIEGLRLEARNIIV